MLRTYTTLIALSCLLVACSWAQGLDTKASKNDWEEINFEFNSAVLSDGYPSLLRLADLLSKNSGYHVRVEGNTDNIGGKGYNEKLGLARANTVREFLVKYGAKPDQITAVSRGKDNPGYSGYKNRYGKTDVARWMNRRVVLTVTDQNGKVVGDGGVGEAIAAVAPATPEPQKCCDDILKRLDKLDDIARMLRDLADQNAGLRREIDNLKQQEAALENKVNGLPKPLTEDQTASVVDKRLEAFRDPRFSLQGLNVGADDRGRVTFSGAARYFAPYKDHFAVQAQGEYLYFHDQKEAQFDLGMVDRIGRFQGGLFASFKHVQLSGYQNGGTLGQGSAVFDYIFKGGTIGVFGTKGFLDNPILDTRNLVLSDGSIAPNIFTQRFLHIVDQAGVQTTLGLIGRTYLQGNVAYLRSYSYGDRVGGTLRFVFPISDHFAFTAEGGVNETMLPIRGSNGRAVFGITWGNLMRPKEFAESKYPVPVQVPRIRYEVVSRTIHRGTSPPVADAGPDQIGIPAGTVTLNGSGSHDPNGEALKFQWVQEAGPTVALSSPTSAITTFQATEGQSYTFRLTVTNTDGQYASARTHVTTASQPEVNILFFIANPNNIQLGQSSQLQYSVQNATTVTISGIGSVNPNNGSLSVSPTQTTTYTLTATNAKGTKTATATVTVTTPQPQFLTCTATPMTIISGESATVLYATQNATSVTVSPNPNAGTLPTSGSFVVSPTQTTTYTLTATNTGLTATCNVTISVTPGSAPQIVRFSGAPLTIPQGGTSTLVWQVNGADTVNIQPQLGNVPLVGTQDVTLQQTTTYTLTATNKFGTATASVTITVTTPPPPPPTNPTITSFTANPPTSPSPGAPVVLTCLAKDATTVTINGVGNVNSAGQVTVNPQVDTTYTCTATGATGTTPATATVTVKVTQTPPPPPPPPVIVITGLNGLTCSAPTVPAGGGPSLIICETVVRFNQLDLSQSSSPSGATPLSFLTTSRNIQAAVLNPTSTQPLVELSALFGDYFFDVTVTDSKGNIAQGVVDIRYIRTR